MCKEAVTDVSSLGARIITNVNAMEELRQKSTRLQGKISGDMKRMLKEVKLAAQELVNRVKCDTPVEDVRAACSHLVAENDKLSAEVFNLREQALSRAMNPPAALLSTNSSNKGSVIKSIEKVSPGLKNAVQKFRKVGDSNEDKASSSNGVFRADQNVMVNQISEKIFDAVKTMLKKEVKDVKAHFERQFPIQRGYTDSDTDRKRDKCGEYLPDKGESEEAKRKCQVR